jgi:hypothetical protein
MNRRKSAACAREPRDRAPGRPGRCRAYSPTQCAADYAVMVFRLFEEEKENHALADNGSRRRPASANMDYASRR